MAIATNPRPLNVKAKLNPHLSSLSSGSASLIPVLLGFARAEIEGLELQNSPDVLEWGKSRKVLKGERSFSPSVQNRSGKGINKCTGLMPETMAMVGNRCEQGNNRSRY